MSKTNDAMVGTWVNTYFLSGGNKYKYIKCDLILDPNLPTIHLVKNTLAGRSTTHRVL